MLSPLDSAAASQRIVARDVNGALTGQALAARVRQLAAELNEHRIRILALQSDNGIAWLMVDLACQLAGICLVPLPGFFSSSQRKHVIHKASVDAVITNAIPEYSGDPETRVSELKTPLPDALQLLRLPPGDTDPEMPPGTQKITFTSGSTGQPKGVCLSLEQQLIEARALADRVGLAQPRHLCLLPLATLLENIAGIYTPLLCGGEVCLPGLAEVGFTGSSSIDPQRFLTTLERWRPDSIILTPQLLQLTVSAAESGWTPPSSLKFVAVGGARVAPGLLQRAQRHAIPAFEGYGLSECASVVSLNTPAERQTGSCGKVLPHLQVGIENGEIMVSGNPMLGYLAEPQSWGQSHIATGDLGRVTDDGFIQISGRRKNLLISSFGRNINPEWVESELLADGDLTECIVLGDARPYCVALLSPRDSGTSDQSIEQAVERANKRLPDYARVRRWSRLPRPLHSQTHLLTANGRPRRAAIQRQFAPQIDSLYANADGLGQSQTMDRWKTA
ncbi:AMP-binding protein [Elongatibacter sediminis]|uniref:AMP-binding protein n=1 Tax=Elongatibacter sediminis TaxID=3119006 RepID=A0AAW9REF7_9GAMM